jgi:hypothetical protein
MKTMNRRRSLSFLPHRFGFALLIILTLALLQVGVVGAATSDGLDWTVGCNGFTSQGGSIVLDRDNTGQGRETFVILATDGEGRVIFGPAQESSFVGARISYAEGTIFHWTRQPIANPLLVTVTSPAGNDQPERTIYSAIGSCEDLQAVSVPGIGRLFIPDGTTSPSVALNTDPPRPTNPQGIGRLQPDGYLIVNTASLNLRSGDGPQYTIVGRVRGGTELLVHGTNERRTWWYVEVGDIIGWVNGELLIARGDLRRVPVVPVLGELFLPRLFVYRANPIYQAANLQSGQLCVIDGDLEYTIVGQIMDGSWFAIAAVCDGEAVTGWIEAEQGALRNSGDLRIPVLR